MTKSMLPSPFHALNRRHLELPSAQLSGAPQSTPPPQPLDGCSGQGKSDVKDPNAPQLSIPQLDLVPDRSYCQPLGGQPHRWIRLPKIDRKRYWMAAGIFRVSE